jgi:glyoxylase I family protein
VVVADEQAVEAGVARGPGPFDHPPGAGANVHGWIGAAERDPNLHEMQPRAMICVMATRDLTELESRRQALREQYLRPASERPPSIGRGVHHLALICADPERTIRFYQDVVGFPLVELFENRDYEGSSHFFFDIGNGNMLGFFDFPGLGLEPVPEGLGGVQHFAISVTPEVFEAAKVRLADAGVEYLGPEMGVKESIYFKDPDNIQVELIRQPLFEMPESAPS